MKKKKKKNWSMSIGPIGHRILLSEPGKGAMLYAENRDDSLKCGYRCRSLRHRDKERAIKWAQEQVAKWIAGDESLTTSIPTVERVIGAYLANKTPEKSPSEQKADHRRARMWANFLGKKFDLSKLTLQRWMQFIKARRTGAIDAQGQPRGQG